MSKIRHFVFFIATIGSAEPPAEPIFDIYILD